MSIKAIETRYKGFRFRSRLEARWAVFFDTLGLPFRYEVEGYVLGDGRRYLPDFWLGNDDKFIVEIKPSKPHWPCRGWLREVDDVCFDDILSMMEVCQEKSAPGAERSEKSG
jgi:hypothetical protein